jgi:glycosidase
LFASSFRRSAVALLALAAVPRVLHAQDFKKEVIYQIITDRFFDGDPTNNDPPQSRGMYDPTKTNWQAYWGGDLKGIEDKLPYLHAMGVTALWISPPVDNSNKPWMGPDGKPVPYLFAPYHGYGARDFTRIDEHFGDAKNDWVAFDNMVEAAHRLGMKIIVDYSPNDTNLINTGEYGAVYDNEKLLGTYADDTKHLYHHNGMLTDWTDPYQIQYYNVFGLADLDHDNPVVDAYIKKSITQFQDHGVDAFRIDAVKHIEWGWVYSLADTVHRHKPAYIFAEWFQDGLNDKFYSDAVKFSNHSAIPLIDYPLGLATRAAFAYNSSFALVQQTLDREDKDFADPNGLITFVDNHDIPRLLSINNNRHLLDEATAFVLTARGIPVVYYGDEHYLHNDSNKGNDPYTRPWMSSFAEDTVGFKLVQNLTALRRSNDALAYGSMVPRSVTQDTYVFERKFANDIILIAINKNETKPATLTDLASSLPAGTYTDELGGLLEGVSLSVESGTTPDANAIAPITLPPHSVSVWQSTAKPNEPAVGALEPTEGEPGATVVLTGLHFGNKPGSVAFGDTNAKVVSWTDTQVTALAPSMHDGTSNVRLTDYAGKTSTAGAFTLHRARLIPVTFTVTNAPVSRNSTALYISGDTAELDNEDTNTKSAPGPFLCPQAPTCFLDISVPAGATVHFHYFIVDKSGAVTWQEKATHAYTVPTQGTGKALAEIR